MSTSNPNRLSAAQMVALYQHGEEDQKLVRAAGVHILPELPSVLETFYDWLREQPDFSRFFHDERLLRHVQEQQHKYWREFFECPLDEAFFASRRILGDVHARTGLSLHLYFAGLAKFLRCFHDVLTQKSSNAAAEYGALSLVAQLDASVVVETYSDLTNQIIREQNEALREMATPVTAIWNEIIMLPVVGIVDSKRAQDMMNAMLGKISETLAKVIILDISGVGVVDTAVANHFIKITRATRLMGCETIISGVSSAIAQTIVELGIDISEVVTTSTLQDAIRMSFERRGYQVRAPEKNVRALPNRR